MKCSSDTHELSDEELVLMMANNEEDPAAAKIAWGEFYVRHREYVFKVICRQSRNWPGFDDDLRGEFVHDVFIKTYDKAGTFKTQNFTDRDQARRWVRGWVGQIANRLLVDGIRKNKGVIPLSYDDEKVQEKAERIKEARVFGKKKTTAKVQIALEQLNTKERKVLETYAIHWNGESKQLTIPDDELAELAESLSTTKSNIRQIKKRTLTKIEKILDEESSREEG